MKCLIYRNEIIDDRQTKTYLNNVIIKLNENLLKSGCKITYFTDGKKHRPLISVRKDVEFKGRIQQREYEKWLQSDIYKK